MAQSELTQLKELHERIQATVDHVEKIRDDACAVSEELSARRRDVLMQLESLRERAGGSHTSGADAPAKPPEPSVVPAQPRRAPR
jgi:hypothetical protein